MLVLEITMNSSLSWCGDHYQKFSFRLSVIKLARLSALLSMLIKRALFVTTMLCGVIFIIDTRIWYYFHVRAAMKTTTAPGIRQETHSVQGMNAQRERKEYWVIFDWCERTWTSSSSAQRWNLPWNYSVMCWQSAVDIVALSTTKKPFNRHKKWIFIDFCSLFTPSRLERKFLTCLTMSWSLFTFLFPPCCR